MSKTRQHLPPAPGVIEPDRLYTAKELRARLGIGINFLRQQRRRGLRVVAAGNQRCVLGRDLIEHLLGQSDAS